ncbi:MAG: phage major capsid protein [Dermatophilaceae bacterium]|nr:phage major capsid protein [Dermatophilaceae bacterium]
MSTTTKTRREQLEKLTAEMQSFADEVDAKDAGPSGEDMAKLTQMGRDVKALVDAIKAEAEADGSLTEAKSYLGSLAEIATGHKSDRREVTEVNGLVNPKGMSLGEALVKSPAYGEFVEQFRGADGAIRQVANIRSASFDVPGFTKDAITGASDTSAGAFVTPARYLPVTDLIGVRELTVRDLCTQVPIQSDTFEFVRVTGKTNAAAGVPEATTSADVDGTTVTDALGGVKPESAMTFAAVSTPVETIAHLMPITRRAAADASQVRSLVDAFLLSGLAEEEEDQLLNGNGTSPNLRGILQTSGISTVGSAGTDIDAIVDAIRTIRADRLRPTAMVVHPNDWFSTGFLLAKDSQNRYLLGDPRASVDQLSTLWGLRVVVTEAMTENTVLVGDFSKAVVADREQSAIYVTDSHKDWFGRNLLAVLAEERLGFGVLDPDAFCTVTAV